MQITLKLYATLGGYLPEGAFENTVSVDVPADASLNSIIDTYRVPRELTHLVLVNGIFFPRSDRDRSMLKEGDAVAIWPPIAGG